MQQRLQVLFSGTVQGVGFRYVARDAARRHAVAGWVRNRPDGRVEAVGEAEREQLLKFLADLRQGSMRDNIRDMAISWGDATGEFAGFSIRFAEPLIEPGGLE